MGPFRWVLSPAMTVRAFMLGCDGSPQRPAGGRGLPIPDTVPMFTLPVDVTAVSVPLAAQPPPGLPRTPWSPPVRAPTVKEWAAAQPPTNVAPLLCSMLGNQRGLAALKGGVDDAKCLGDGGGTSASLRSARSLTVGALLRGRAWAAVPVRGRDKVSFFEHTEERTLSQRRCENEGAIPIAARRPCSATVQYVR